MVSDQAVGLGGRVLSGTPRDSLHMIDLIYSKDAGQRPEVIITDTGSYSDIAFGLSRCWTSITARSSPPSPTPAVAHRSHGRYGSLNSAPRGKIDLGSIRRQRPDILRVVASTHTGAVAATTSCASSRPAVRRRSSATACALRPDLQTLHVLSYVDDEPYRRDIKAFRNLQEAATTSLAPSFTARSHGCREGMEDQLGALNLILTTIAL
jgi:TnpA family transposase